MARKKRIHWFANHFGLLLTVALLSMPLVDARLTEADLEFIRSAPASKPTVDYAKRGDEQLKQGRYNEAAKSYEKAIEESPTRAPYYATMARIEWTLGDYSGAIANYVEFLKYDPIIKPFFEFVVLLGIVALGVLLVLGFNRWLGAAGLFQTAAICFLLHSTTQNSWDNDYSTLLNLLVCPVAAFTAHELVSCKKLGFAWFLGAIAVLFNPVFRVQLESETWQAVNFVASILLASALTILHLQRRKQRRQKLSIELQHPNQTPSNALVAATRLTQN